MTSDRTCRDDVLEAVRSLRSRHPRDVFTLDEIVQEVYARGSTYKVSTIRTHVSSKLCTNAPDNHYTVYDDLERISPGHYRLLLDAAEPESVCLDIGPVGAGVRRTPARIDTSSPRARRARAMARTKAPRRNSGVRQPAPAPWRSI